MNRARRMITLGMAAAMLAGWVITAAPARAGLADVIGGIKFDNVLPTDPVQWSPTSLDLGTLEAGETRTANLTVVSPTDASVTAAVAADATFRVERITSYKWVWVRVGSGITASWQQQKVVDQSVAGNSPVPVKAQQEFVVVIRGTGLDNGRRSATLTVAGGALWKIRVPIDATVWGSAHEVYQLSRSGFVRIPGNLRQVAVGPRSSIWGANDRDEVFRFNPNTQRFERFPDSPNLREIVVGKAGSVWGLTRDGAIYRLNTGSEPWYFAAIPGRLSQIAIGGDEQWERVWGVNAAGEVYLFDTRTQRFERKPGRIYQIAVDPRGNAFGLGDVNGSNADVQLGSPGRAIYWLDLMTNAVRPLAGSLAQLATPWGFEAWGINDRGELFQLDWGYQKFRQVPGLPAFTQIAGYGGYIWVISRDGAIYVIDILWQTIEQVPGQLSRIAVGGNGDAWGIKDVAALPK